MPFSEEVEIPPIFVKILKKIEEKGQVNIDEFRKIILGSRITIKDLDKIEQYFIDGGFIQRIPKLVPSENGGAKDIIVLTSKSYR